jgi:hypothetical protein
VANLADEKTQANFLNGVLDFREEAYIITAPGLS